MLEAKLVIVGGAEVAQEYPLTLPASIGRGQENSIPLSHPLVSRKHCQLSERNGSLFVEDLGSLNGTFIGNQPVEKPSVIEPGQLLTIGTVTFRAIYGGYSPEADDVDVIESDFAQAVSPGSNPELTCTRPAAATLAPEAVLTERLDSGVDQEIRDQADTERIEPSVRRPR